MHHSVIVSPLNILLEYALSSSIDLSETIVKDLIATKRPFTEKDCIELSEIFKTSTDFWINICTNYSKVFDEKPLENYVIEAKDIRDAASITSNQKVPTSFEYTSIKTDRDIITQKMYILTEQAFNYLHKGLTQDEVWDLGYLGCSEDHVVSKPMNSRLKNAIDKLKNMPKDEDKQTVKHHS